MMKDTDLEIGRYEEFTPIWGPHLPSAKAAKKAGAKYFFTGKPCKRGHIEPRYAHGSCTACKAEDRAAKSEENKEYFRLWRRNNPDKTDGYHKKQKEEGYYKDYYERNRDEILRRDREWRRNNPEKTKEMAKRHYQKNGDERRRKAREKYAEDGYDKERASTYRRKNRKRLAAKTAEWRRANPELVRTLDRNKKLRRKGAEGKHTHQDVLTLMEKQGYKCAECGTSVRNEYHVDHIMPLSKGGTNWPTNLQILCPTCNMEKHAADPIDWARRKGRLV